MAVMSEGKTKTHPVKRIAARRQTLGAMRFTGESCHVRASAKSCLLAQAQGYFPRVRARGVSAKTANSRARARARVGASAISAFSRGVRGFYTVQQRRSPALVRRHAKEGPCAPRGWPSPALCVLPCLRPVLRPCVASGASCGVLRGAGVRGAQSKAPGAGLPFRGQALGRKKKPWSGAGAEFLFFRLRALLRGAGLVCAHVREGIFFGERSGGISESF